MITKIIKLKDFGLFRDFTWNSNPAFKKYNLIYGWNRSGKTTISRVFSAFEKESTLFKRFPKDGGFEIRLEDNGVLKNSDVKDNSLSIKVFNQDFIDENLSFDPSDSCKPIIYISEEDIESKKKLDGYKNQSSKLGELYCEAVKDKIKKEETKNNFLTSVGREIANILFDKTYNKIKVENKIKEIDSDNLDGYIINEKEKEKTDEVRISKAKDKKEEYQKISLLIDFEGKSLDNFDDIYTEVDNLLKKKIVSETLERLKVDEGLNNWVKQGFELHGERDEEEKCLFCQKPLEKEFLDSLSKHFSKDYNDLQNKITAIGTSLKAERKIALESIAKELYPDLTEPLSKKIKEVNEIAEDLNDWINKVLDALRIKYKNPLHTIELREKPKSFDTLYNEKINKINEIIKKHNLKVDNHEVEVEKAKGKIELHIIATEIKEQNFIAMKEELTKAKEDEIKSKKNTEANNAKIKEYEEKTSNIGGAIKKINEDLDSFFGRKEIQLELDGDKKGYLIKRDEVEAHNLSEGEKTAIAFSYFIAKTREKDFDIKKGIIFIDDPISSFDSNFIYHCFSLVKNNFGEARQLFISTHNFEFLNLSKEWFFKKNSKQKRKEQDKNCEFYMIENVIEDEKRCASLVPLEEIIKKFKSEYHYLFFLLNRFIENDTTEYADYYIIGNIARRFLEIFTNFKIPTTGDLASKILALKINPSVVSVVEQDKVYKLIQEFSHGFDPTSSVEHKDKVESKEAVKILLKMIKVSDEKHFMLLKKTIEAN